MLLWLGLLLPISGPWTQYSRAVAPSPDGKQLAYAVTDGTVRLAALPAGNVRWCSAGLPAEIDDIAWSPDGERLAAIAHDARVFVLRTADGGKVFELGPGDEFLQENHSPSTVAYLSGGTRLIAVGGRAKARLCDAATGETLRSLLGDTQFPQTASAVSADGEHFALGDGGGSFGVYGAATGELEVGPIHGPMPVNALAFDPRGKQLAVGAGDHDARVYRLSNPRGPRIFSHADNDWLGDLQIGSVEFSEDGKSLLTGCFGWWQAKCWDLEQGTQRWSYDHQGGNPAPMPVAFARDPGLVLIAVEGRVHEAKRGSLVRRLSLAYGWWRTSRACDYAWATIDSALEIVDIRDGKPVCKLPLTPPPAPPPRQSRAQALAPDGSLFAFAVDDGTVHVVALPDGGPVSIAKGLSPLVEGLGFSPDAKELAVVARDGSVRVLATADGSVRARIRAPSGTAYVPWRPHSVFYVDGGRALLVAGGSTVAALIDRRSGREEIPYRLSRNGPITAVATSSDGEHFALGDSDGIVALYRSSDGDLEFGPVRVPTRIRQLSLDAHGTRIAVASRNCQARVYTPASGNVPALYSHCRDELVEPEVCDVCLSPDGRQLLVCTSGGWQVRLWDVEATTTIWRYDFEVPGEEAIEARFAGETGLVLASPLGAVLDRSSGKSQRFLGFDLFRGAGAHAWRATGGRISISDVRTGKVVCELPLDAN